LILLDVMMPEMDGYAVCQHLKATAATAAIPILFVSGHATEVEKTRGLALGAVGFVTKPIDPNQLLAQLAALFPR
jgi:DNA-binding response OmpR family regulator